MRRRRRLMCASAQAILIIVAWLGRSLDRTTNYMYSPAVRQRHHHRPNNAAASSPNNNNEENITIIKTTTGTTAINHNSSEPPLRHHHHQQLATTTIIDWDGISDGNRSLKHFMLSYWRKNAFCDQIIAANLLLVRDSNRTTNTTPATSSRLCGTTSSSILNSSATAVTPDGAVVDNTALTFRIALGSCRELHEKGTLGTGNYLTGIYGIMLAARVLRINQLELSCHDAIAESARLILPWVMGRYRFVAEKENNGSGDHQRWWPPAAVVEDAVCSTYNQVPIGYMASQMRRDLRRMAVSLVGIPPHPHHHPAATWWAAQQHKLWDDDDHPPDPDHPNDYEDEDDEEPGRYRHQLPVSRTPLLPNVELDDSVVHFRCGDIMNGVSMEGYGFMKFAAYARRLSAEHARSIGIVTQPFASSSSSSSTSSKDNGAAGTAAAAAAASVARGRDPGFNHRAKSGGDRCEIVVVALADYLRARFPDARITIRNGPNETLALSYARLIMAHETAITGMSSFGVFAVVATFAQRGYVRQQQNGRGPHLWTELHPRIQDSLDNVELMDEPNVILGSDVRDLWDSRGEAAVLSWFRDENLTLWCNETVCTMMMDS